MATQDTRPRPASSEGRRANAAADPQQASERAADEHDRSADIYESHAVLLDRFGAHRSARTERRHAEDERDAAETARQDPPADPPGDTPS
jgi:hypothetical protein